MKKKTGTEGLSANFYKCFRCDMKCLIMDSLLHMTKTGELSIEQKWGVITLLPKTNKDRPFLKKWRPIALFSTDYNIIAKLLANRMKKVTTSIISEDQSGLPRGRYIGQKIRLLQDISFLLNSNNYRVCSLSSISKKSLTPWIGMFCLKH